VSLSSAFLLPWVLEKLTFYVAHFLGARSFRHFNVALLDSLCVPLKVIQERAGHALTGSFTLDVYGGKPEWVGNVEAARKAGLAIEQSVAKAQETEPFVGLTAIKEERLPITKSEALMNQ
jgi:hypothetical protein